MTALDSVKSLVSVKSLGRSFLVEKKFLRKPRLFHAVSDVSFDIGVGEIVGVVGESGCGKSTLARLIMRLLKPSSGQVFFENTDIAGVSRKDLQKIRRRFQMVFQDPYSSIDPRQTMKQALLEPFQVQGISLSPQQSRDVIEELLDMVSINPSLADTYTHQLSGGQKQRIGIARALALKPSFIVLDEPTASLDVSVQAQIVQLLLQLRKQLNLTYMFISHDLALVRYLCDRILVMYLGRVVEIMQKDAEPAHPYTQALLDSSFEPNPSQRRNIVRIRGEIPSGYNLPKGCAFFNRCPRAQPICELQRPELEGLDAKHAVACHFPLQSHTREETSHVL